MMVLIVQKVPATLRGELSRWMIEPRAGVFVGDVSAMVRDKLWEKATRNSRGGGVMLLYSSPTEQGFKMRVWGDTTRDLLDVDGLTLVHVPEHTKRKATGAGTIDDPVANSEGESDPFA